MRAFYHVCHRVCARVVVEICMFLSSPPPPVCAAAKGQGTSRWSTSGASPASRSHKKKVPAGDAKPAVAASLASAPEEPTVNRVEPGDFVEDSFTGN